MAAPLRIGADRGNGGTINPVAGHITAAPSSPKERRVNYARQPETPALLSDEAIGALKRRIVTGELAPGAWVSEGDLTELLGMSKTPVREALAVLRRQGWITATPRSGYRIRSVTVRETRDLLDLQAVLEPMAAAKAAIGSQRYPGEVEKLAAFAVDSTGHTWANSDEILAHYRFHRRLTALGNNRELDLLLADLHLKLHQAFVIARKLDTTNLPDNTDHRRIVEAIARHDPEAARRAAAEHVTAIRTWLITALIDSDAVLDAGISGRSRSGFTKPRARSNPTGQGLR
ncbi:MAG: FCD domain-containing protein [Streptosporangiales bacterium]|nr:FCD domain-containing protein [Streptosporangiales bacterium]